MRQIMKQSLIILTAAIATTAHAYTGKVDKYLAEKPVSGEYHSTLSADDLNTCLVSQLTDGIPPSVTKGSDGVTVAMTNYSYLGAIVRGTATYQPDATGFKIITRGKLVQSRVQKCTGDLGSK